MLLASRIVIVAGLLASSVGIGGRPAGAQIPEETSCAAALTDQLRRFSEKCLADLITFVASRPDMGARIYSEQERYYVVLTRSDGGLLAHAVSKFNYPFMKDETAELLKQQGWRAPENESDNWTKRLEGEQIRNGTAAQEIGQALRAYGLKDGEALSLTVGPQVSDKTPPA